MNLRTLSENLDGYFIHTLKWTSKIEVVDSLGAGDTCLHMARFNDSVLRVESRKQAIPPKNAGAAILDAVDGLLTFCRRRPTDDFYVSLLLSQDGYFSVLLVQSRRVGDKTHSTLHVDFS